MKNLTKRMLACLLMAAMLIPVVPTGFVYAATDTTTVPGWSCEMNADGGVSVDTTEKFSGNASMKLYNNTVRTSGEYIRISYPIAVQPGHSYRYGFMAKVEKGQSVYAQMNWDRTALGHLTPTGKTADWRAFEFVYNNADETTAYLRFVMENKTDGLWIDDVYFYDTSLPMTAENNLIKNPSFEGIQSAQAVSNVSQDLIPVSKTDAVVVDGNLKEWENVPKRTLEIYTDYQKAPQSVTADIRYLYDDTNFYFALDVEDDVHYPISAGSYWNGDGLQFTICRPDETFGTAYGAVYDAENDITVEFGDTAIDAKTTRKGTQTSYEVAIPWGAYFGEIPTVALFCAIVNDNDDDGYGRKGCVDVAPGISMYKGSQLFPKMMMLKDGEEFAAFFSGTADINTGGTANYTVDMFNQTMASKTLTISSKVADIKETVTLPAGEAGGYTFSMTHTGYGDKEVDITVTDGKKIFTDSVTTNVCADETITKQAIAKQKKYLNELTGLMAECEAKEIPIEYQKVKYNTIDLFIGYMEEDLADGDLERIAETDKVLTRLYTEAKAEFEGYLNGTLEPVSVPQYVTSPVEIDGQHFVATTQREDGTEERRPVFFIGAGHWAATRNREQVEWLSKVGFNATNPEIGPWDAMVEALPVKSWLMKENGSYGIECYASKDVVHDGKTSLKIVSESPYKSNNYRYIMQTVDAKPNTTYEYGISAKGENVKNAYYILTTNGITGVGNKAMRQSLNGTFDWRDDVLTYTTKATEKELHLLVVIEDTASALYLDDAFIRETGSQKNLLANGGFESAYPDDQYYAMDERTVNQLVKTLEACNDFNMSAQFSLAPHYVPKFLIRDYPEIELPQQWGNFNHQDPKHPELLKLYEVFYKSLIPRIKDFEAFDGIVLANEPQYNSMLDSWAFIDDFRNAMKEKYQTIDALNQRWQTTYASFDEVEMPTSLEATPRFYDWRVFNDMILPEWVDHLGKAVKSVAPGVYSSTKIMDVFKTGVNFRVMSSDNYEIMTDYTDINGCDAWSMIATDDVRWKNIFYDFMTSVKEAPIYNTEDHIIVDARKLVYNDKETLYNVVDIWNGAVHGRGGSILWIWDRSSRTKNGTIYFNSLLTARPDSVATLGKTTLDLNRLSHEVVALQNAKADMAILYTPNAVPYSEEMLDIIRKTSAALGENGQKTRFVVESQLEKFDEYKTIVIPNTISLYKETLDKLKSFVDKGGKLLVIGKDALTKNEYGDFHDAATVAHIKAKAVCIGFEDAGTTISTASGRAIKDEITKFVKADGLDKVTFVDKTTGEALADADWISAEYDGAYIINLCSYTWNTREVELYINDEKVTETEDLINFGKYSESITLDGHVPMLLKVKK
ncbi:MAG: beta-galactosidase [Clostridia bacterium]|nr:beta-galactosidase [Clostridia bacterium]